MSASQYRGNLDAVRALVQPDRVHRDLYISPEIFELEQEHFFANTWNYIGHDSQLPKPGDYLSADIAGRPLIAVRHTDGSVRVMMNRCAHKGSRLVSAPCGNTGKFFRCPYHAWTFKTDGALLAIPLKNGYEGTALHECEASKGLTTVPNVKLYRGFIFVKLNDGGPDFETFFGDSLSSIDNMADRSPEGELEIAGGCLRFMHDCNWKMFVENLNDTMHPMVAHESSAGTAKAMWAGQPADAPKPMAVEQFVPFMSDYKFFEDMGVRVFENGHSYSGVNFSIHSKYSAIPAYDSAMKAAYGEERSAQIIGMARHNTVYYPNLISRARSSRFASSSRSRSTRRWSRAGPSASKVRRPSCCSARRCTTGSSTRRSRWWATTTCKPTEASSSACTRAATTGSACTATSMPRKSGSRR